MGVGRFRPPMQVPTRRRRIGGYAWLAALTMTVLAVTPLSAIFHQISAPHAVCEHGELVESGDNHVGLAGGLTDANARWAASEAESGRTSRIGTDSNVARHGHSHCSVGTL